MYSLQRTSTHTSSQSVCIVNCKSLVFGYVIIGTITNSWQINSPSTTTISTISDNQLYGLQYGWRIAHDWPQLRAMMLTIQNLHYSFKIFKILQHPGSMMLTLSVRTPSLEWPNEFSSAKTLEVYRLNPTPEVSETKLYSRTSNISLSQLKWDVTPNFSAGAQCLLLQLFIKQHAIKAQASVL